MCISSLNYTAVAKHIHGWPLSRFRHINMFAKTYNYPSLTLFFNNPTKLLVSLILCVLSIELPLTHTINSNPSTKPQNHKTRPYYLIQWPRWDHWSPSPSFALSWLHWSWWLSRTIMSQRWLPRHMPVMITATDTRRLLRHQHRLQAPLLSPLVLSWSPPRWSLPWLTSSDEDMYFWDWFSSFLRRL